jgi:hypothetical protein
MYRMPRFQIKARYLADEYELIVFRKRPTVADNQAQAIGWATQELDRTLLGLKPVAIQAIPLDDGPGPEGVTTR